MRPSIGIAILLLAAPAAADRQNIEIGGHAKLNLTASTYPDDSLLRDLLGSDTVDLQGDLRLNLKWRKRQWTIDAAYQLIAVQSDSPAVASNLAEAAGVLSPGLPDDGRRLFDMTTVISESQDSAILQRLDRLSIAHTTDDTVIRFGRQALSWGNGFFYAPMDLVNPFDPEAIDSEYKAGDDMLYAQYLRNNGEDVQAAVVFRRDPRIGDVASNQATVAIKYHGFAGEFEYDALIAESYGDTVLGGGAGRAIGGAQWAGDIVITQSAIDTYVQIVTNLSYSWTFAGKNMSGVLEYHFNGFGLRSDRYDPARLSGNLDLRERLLRGQAFTLGRHYLGASVSMEMTPLWTVSPVVLANIGDPSALFQLTSSYSLSDNMTLLGSVNMPVGSKGSEFGGIDSGIPNRYVSIGASLFAQIAWYF